MKIQPLYDLQQEINRLFIAGSKFAIGDPRLLKHVPALQKLGEKAPVFKKLAMDAEELTKTSSEESPEKLLSLSTLLYSVLYTQGETVEEGSGIEEQQPAFDIAGVDTDSSYLQLKPVIEALTTANQGRLELVKDAFERKVFRDFRTYAHLDGALGDKYAELADYIAETVIPAIGTPVLPFIVRNFAYEDKTIQVRRLRILNALNYEGMPEITEKVLAQSLPGLQAEAIRYLAKDVKHEELIRKLADDRNKGVREAAYLALVQYGTRESLAKIKDVYLTGKANPGLIKAMASATLPHYFDEILAQYHKTLDQLLALNKNSPDKEIVDAFTRVAEEIVLFQYEDRQEVYDLFEKLSTAKNLYDLLKAKKTLLSNVYGDLPNNLVYCLQTFDKNKVLRFYATLIPRMLHEDWKREFSRQYFHTCCILKYAREKIYDLFIQDFEKGYITVDDLQYQVFGRERNHYYEDTVPADPNLDILDKRWIPYMYTVAAMSPGKNRWDYEKRAAFLLLHTYEPKDSKKMKDLLTEMVSSSATADADFLFFMIVEREIPDGFDLIYRSLSGAKKNSSYYYSNVAQMDFWKKFPKEYAPKIRELYERDKIAVLNNIADAIEFN